MINPHWTRWVWASVTKYLEDHKGDVVLFFEGDDRPAKAPHAFAEVRMDGPRIKEPSANYYRLDVYVNILTQCQMDQTDAHAHQRLTGAVQAMFAKCIPVFKYGTGPDDTGEMLGTLVLQYSDPLDQVKFANFGQVDETLRLQQATVEGHYKMHLDGA